MGRGMTVSLGRGQVVRGRGEGRGRGGEGGGRSGRGRGGRKGRGRGRGRGVRGAPSRRGQREYYMPLEDVVAFMKED